MQLSAVSDSYDYSPVLLTPRWNLNIPLNLWLGIACCSAAMIIFYMTGYKTWMIIMPAMMFLLILFFRPALGLFLTVIMYVPDQLFSAISGVDFTPGKYLPLLVLLACIRPFLASWNSSPVIRRILRMFLYLICWYFIALVLSPTMDSVSYCLQILLLYLFLFPATGLLGDLESLRKLCYAFVLVGSIGAIIVLSGYGVRYTGTGDRVLYGNLSINAISTNLGLCFIAGIAYWNISGKSLSKYLLIPLLVLLFIAILKTGTRSVIFGVPAAILIPFMIYSGRKFLKYWIAALIYIAAILFVFEFLSSNGMITGTLYKRIVSGIGNNNKSDDIRMNLLKNGLEWYTENPLGCGPGSINEINIVYHGDREAHNTFVSTLLQTGLFGLLLLVSPLIYLFIAASRIRLQPFRISAIMINIYFVMQLNKGSTLQTRIFWFQLLFCLLMIKVGAQESSSGSQNTYMVI
ncbi:MAG: O-antigen ligase family protein [Ignavibacteriales bacterium]